MEACQDFADLPVGLTSVDMICGNDACARARRGEVTAEETAEGAGMSSCWKIARGVANGAGTRVSLPPHDRSGASDQPRQLLEAAADAVGDEIDHPVLEHQHQLAAAGCGNAWRGSTPVRAAEIRCATRNAAPRIRARSSIAGGTSSRISAGGSFSSLRPA